MKLMNLCASIALLSVLSIASYAINVEDLVKEDLSFTPGTMVGQLGLVSNKKCEDAYVSCLELGKPVLTCKDEKLQCNKKAFLN